MSSLPVQTKCLSGKESGGSWKICYYSPQKILLNDGGWVKDMSLVNCVMEQLSFSVDLDDDVQCRKSYHLVASICHSGTLAAGHYTAHVLHKQDSQ